MILPFNCLTKRKKLTEAEADEKLCTDKEKRVERERNGSLDIIFFDNRKHCQLSTYHCNSG